jgi:hypothetical protein
MSSMSDYLETAIADLVCNGSAFTALSTLYVKLHLGAPGEAGTSNAATETTRKSVTFGAASSGVSTSDSAQQWTSYPAAETVSHVSLWDNVSAGNCIFTGALAASKTMGIGDTLDIASGGITVTWA